MFVRLCACARETKWLTKCWGKLSLLTNLRYTKSWYTGMRYWKQCLKAPLLRLSPTPSRFSRKFSRSAFLTILEPGKGYKWCCSLYVSVYIHVACGSCVICKRRGRHLSGLYFHISVGTHNNVIKRRTWSVVFAAVLAIRKCFWLWISKTDVFYRENCLPIYREKTIPRKNIF